MVQRDVKFAVFKLTCCVIFVLAGRLVFSFGKFLHWVSFEMSPGMFYRRVSADVICLDFLISITYKLVFKKIDRISTKLTGT